MWCVFKVNWKLALTHNFSKNIKDMKKANFTYFLKCCMQLQLLSYFQILPNSQYFPYLCICVLIISLIYTYKCNFPRNLIARYKMRHSYECPCNAGIYQFSDAMLIQLNKWVGTTDAIYAGRIILMWHPPKRKLWRFLYRYRSMFCHWRSMSIV